MPETKPKSVADAAFAELSKLLVESVEEVSEFTLARLEKAAKEGIKSDAVHAYQALGMIALFKKEAPASVDEKFGVALRLSSGGSVESNYSSVLIAMNRFREAAHMADKASALEPANLAHLRSAIDVNWYAGRWERSLELTDTLKSRSPNEVSNAEPHRRRILEVLKANGVPLESIEQLHTAMYSFLAGKDIRSRGAEQFIDTSAGEEAVYINVAIDRPSSLVRKLDEEVTPFLFDAVDEFPIGTFSIGLVKFQEEKHVA